MTCRKTEPSGHITRRTFLGNAAVTAGLAAAGTALRPRAAQGRVLGANDRIGFGMIGCGGEGSGLMRMLQRLKAGGLNVEITAVCDVYRPRLDRAAKDFGAKASYMDYTELLADPNVDVVGIATPDHIHGQQAIDAVRSGKDVYCEKPVTHWRQFERTKRLYQIVKKSDRVFQLGSQYMSDSAWSQAKKLVESGLIGKPTPLQMAVLSLREGKVARFDRAAERIVL